MDLTLTRNHKRPDGVFSTITKPDGDVLCVAVTRAYKDNQPKVQRGKYFCQRGTHQLHAGQPFETFEITGVPGHSGILFHKGNYQTDSEGCECVGLSFIFSPTAMVTSSKIAFDHFMQVQEGCDQFLLTVEDEI